MFGKLESVILICLSVVAFGDCKSLSHQSQLEGVSRIVGGNPVPPGDLPFQVSLRFTNNSHFCGGALISERWVLTAANCVYNLLASQILIVVGSDSIFDGTIYLCENITRHELFDVNTLTNDIAVLRTRNNVLNSTLVEPTFYYRFTLACGQSLTTSGWGDTQNGGALYLEYLNVTSISTFGCKVILSGNEDAQHIDLSTTTSQQTCVFGTFNSGSSVCNGDNGAPLFRANSRIVTGILSYATCTENIPAVYTVVGYYQAWIFLQTGVESTASY